MATAFACSDKMAARTCRPSAAVQQFAGRPKVLLASRPQLRRQNSRQVTRMAVSAAHSKLKGNSVECIGGVQEAYPSISDVDLKAGLNIQLQSCGRALLDDAHQGHWQCTVLGL